MAVIYNISGREVIRRIYDHYDIKTTDWEERAYDWIDEAIGHVKMYSALEPCHLDITISNYKAKLPCDIKVLEAVQIDGVKQELALNGRINAHDTTVLKELGEIAGDTYELNRRGYLISSNETGTARIHYRKLPVEFDDELQHEVPLVPNDKYLLLTVEFYLLWRILSRGYKHPVYKIGSSNPRLDPGVQWERYAPKASNSMASFNKDERDRIRKINNTLHVNANRAQNRDINTY